MNEINDNVPCDHLKRVTQICKPPKPFFFGFFLTKSRKPSNTSGLRDNFFLKKTRFLLDLTKLGGGNESGIGQTAVKH